MGFKVYFLNTFPSEAQLSKLFKLFNDLFWDLDQIKFENGNYEDFLGVREDLVVISPDIKEPFLFWEEEVFDYINLFLPISTSKWNEVENLLQRVWEEDTLHQKKLYVFRSIPNTDIKIEEISCKRIFLNEKYLSVVSESKYPPKGLDIFTSNGEELEEVVGNLLRKKGLSVATAESCTGGLVAASLVNVPGSSEYFKGSVVAYANEVKEKVLGVKRETLENFGAVSQQTAEEMALGVKRLLGTDIGISTTGIAGPGGGTPQKPVGLTYFAIAYPKGVKVFKKVFPYDRNQNRLAATYFILYQLYKLLNKEV